MVFWVVILAGACKEQPAATELVVPTVNFFSDVSEASGIQLGNYSLNPQEGTVINDHSRVAFSDLNGDGFDDIVMHSLFPNVMEGVPFEHLIFLNDGDGTFSDFSGPSGLADVHAAFFSFADIDNDGDQDLFAGADVSGPTPNSIYLNDGHGVFTVVVESGVEQSPSSAANALFVDANSDGMLDLFVGHGGTTSADFDRFYLGNGDGTFTEDASRLPDGPRQPSNGSVSCDFDDDGDQDLFVSTYSVSTENGANILWENDGTGHFTETAFRHGFAVQTTGNYYLKSTKRGKQDEPGVGPKGAIGSNGFGIDCGDVNGDGRFDVLLSAISHPVDSDYSRKWSDPSQLLINQGEKEGKTFVNQWLSRGLPFNEGDIDAAFVDFDNDGLLDISLSRESKYEGAYDDEEQQGWFGLMHQMEDGGFRSVGLDSGINGPLTDAFERMKGAQNHAWSDIDGDGDLDLLVGGRDQGGGRPNFLFQNNIGQENPWLQVRLEGDGAQVNRDAIGAQVSVESAGWRRVREVHSSRGMYSSQDTRVLQFGLHGLEPGARLTVRWPDGLEVVFPGELVLNAGMRLRIVYPDYLEFITGK